MEFELARKLITPFLDGFWEGLSRPLTFFDQASAEYIDQINNSRARKDPLLKAREAYEEIDASDEHIALLYRHRDPWEGTCLAEFKKWARLIGQPEWERRIVQ
jgi:hypothetical protein